MMTAATVNTTKTGSDMPETWNAWNKMTKFQFKNGETEKTDKVTDS